MTEQETVSPSTSPPSSRVRRLGCQLAVVLWFLLLLTPCLVIVLATRGEISISTGSAPDQELRIWLVMEARSRGLGVSNASLHEQDSATCVQTDVQFWLWQGSEAPTSYCECYTREGESYRLMSTAQGTC